jgi:NO-binding membrane sensor protein with MHYT domain
MACAVGGIGIWSMHMVGMASMMLMYEDGTEIPMTFKVDVTILSLFAVIICCFVGMKIASQDKMFAKRKSEIAEEFIQDAKFMTMSQIRGIDPKQIFIIMTTQSLGRLLLGGLIASVGICIMHYVGVMGMEFGGEIVYDVGILTASCLIAVVAAIAAFWILFRLLSIYPRMESLRVVSSLVFTIAKCGMHYTGMAAARFYIPAGHPPPSDPSATLLSQQEIMSGALVATFIVSWSIIMLIFSDLRQSNNLLNHQVMIAERAIYDAKHDKSVVMLNYSISKYAFVKPAEIYAPRGKSVKPDESA